MKYKKTVLDNGLRIITVPMKESQTAIGMVMVEAGSDYEDKKINGLSHFLEHMCFKGTENRTLGQINEELDALGAVNNAFTGNEYTGYYAKARFKKIDKIIEIVSDMYINPTFPEKDIEIERGVILEEINMYANMYPIIAFYEYNELLYPNQPAGRKILGSKENIKKFKREDFVKYHQTHYIPQKTVVIVAGNIDQAKVIKQVKEQFGHLKKGKIVRKKKVIDSQKGGAKIKINNKSIDQTHLIVGFRSFGMGDKRHYALDVAKAVLGSGMSARLFKRLRDELGMCYYVKAANHASTDSGNFLVTSGVTNSRAVEAVEAIVEEMRRLRDEDISAKELKKAKDVVLGQMATGLETSDDWAEYYGDQELFRQKINTPKDYEKKIRAVTDKDIKRVLKQIMKNDRLNLAIVGPQQKNQKALKKALKI
jgi:predicted Zn-dependent peptidase